jgi:hypothetical protein
MPAITLLNWDFENGDDGNWTLQDLASIVNFPALAYQGDQYLWLWSNKSAFGPVDKRSIAENTMTLVVGQKIWIDFRWNAIDAPGGECDLKVNIDPGDGVYQEVANLDYSLWTPGGYNYFKTAEIDIVGTAGRVRFASTKRTTNGSESFYIDNVQPWSKEEEFDVPTGPLDQVTICNVALSLIGVSKQITSITEDTTEATACNLHYDLALSNILEEANWPFAIKRANLALYAGTAPNDWGYQYAYPSDCVRPMLIVDPQQALTYYEFLLWVQNIEGRYLIPFKVESIGGDKVIYSDMENACLAYVFLNTDTAKYPQAFSNALAWQLASMIAMSVTGDRAVKFDAEAGAKRALDKAVAHAFNSEQEKPEPLSEFERARW